MVCAHDIRELTEACTAWLGSDAQKMSSDVQAAAFALRYEHDMSDDGGSLGSAFVDKPL